MVIVVDTSAWLDLFRDRRTPVASALERLIASRADLAITETVLMELLAGARSGEALAQVRMRMLGRPILQLEGLDDFEEAARIYRACRAAGETLRSQLDLLIAVPTIRHGATLLHNDRDFETIARHSALTIEPVHGAAPPDGRALRERAGRWKATTARSRAPRGRRSGTGARLAVEKVRPR